MEDKLRELENHRKKIMYVFVAVTAISVLITVLLLIFFASIGALSNGGFQLSLIAGAGLGYLLYFISGLERLIKKFRAEYKSVFVEVPFSQAFDQVIYRFDEGISEERLEETGMIHLGNIYHSNDLVQGVYKGIRFERADVKIQQHVQHGRSSTTVTYFNGRWLIFDFNKPFHYDLQIIDKEFEAPKKRNTFFTEADVRRHKIELEDILFNETFNVYAQDDHEAFYIITPQLMEVLKELHETMDGNFMLGFYDNQLHMAINTERDAMECSIFESIDPSSLSTEVQKEINVIINIINALKLDRDIYENYGG